VNNLPSVVTEGPHGRVPVLLPGHKRRLSELWLIRDVWVPLGLKGNAIALPHQAMGAHASPVEVVAGVDLKRWLVGQYGQPMTFRRLGKHRHLPQTRALQVERVINAARLADLRVGITNTIADSGSSTKIERRPLNVLEMP
jgi:hypothetical protein